MKKVLVPVDGSRFAEAALPTAINIARRAGAELSLVMVGVPENPPTGVWADAFHENHMAYLEGLTESVKAQGDDIDVTATLLDGSVEEALCTEIEEWAPDLVVMTTHGRGGLARAWLGSVADTLLRNARTPTLLVRPDGAPGEGPEWGDPLEIVVPVDGTTFAESALAVTTRLATLFDARITLVRVVPYPSDTVSSIGGTVVDYAQLVANAKAEARSYVASLAKRVEESIPRVDSDVLLATSVARGILDRSSEVDADVIVVASHARGGLSRVVLGSTADKLVRGARRSVLVVPIDTEES